MPTPDDVLLKLWTDRADAEAFAELVRRHAAMVHSACRRIVRDHALADDLSQECFLRLAEAEPAPDRNLAGWLHRVATRRALSLRRTLRRQVAAFEDGIDGGIDDRTPDRAAEWREVEARVDAAIAALPDAQRAAVVGHFLEGLSHRELARALGVSQRTVGYRVERGVDAVRDALRRSGLRVERAGLVGWFSALPSDPLSPALVAALGKAAIAGPGALPAATSAALAVTAIAAGGSVKSSVLGVAAGVVLVIASVWLATRPAPAPTIPAERSNGTARSFDAAADEIADAGDASRVEVRGEATALPSALSATPTATLSGRVQTPDGLAVPGATVILVEVHESDRGPLESRWELDPARVSRATCDDDGNFAIARRDASRRACATAFRDGLAGDRTWIAAASDAEITLVLHPGRALRGRVSGLDGAPLAGSLVTIEQCWTAEDYAEFGSGFARTGARGEFAIGIAADAVGCTLRVDAPALGPDLFVGVPTDAFADLRWNARATVRGHVAGMRGDRTGRIRVEVSGTLDDPPIPVWRSGLRLPQRFSAEVAADGSFAVTGVQPGLRYAASLVEVGADDARRRLSPDTLDRFTLAPGEIAERNFELERPILVTGRVTTATTRHPVAGARLEVTMEGSTHWDAFASTDAAGRYELTITGGPGSYQLRALPRHSVGSKAPADATSGVERQLQPGDRAEIDLVLPEPTVIQFRVVDPRGVPIPSVRTELMVTTADGRHAQIGDSFQLDADGRGRIELFDPISAARLSVARFPAGPHSAVALTDLDVGGPLAEQTVILRDACSVTGTLLDRDGRAIGGATVRVSARYDDGGADQTSVSTDRDGRFTVDGGFRAAAADLELTTDDGRRATARVPATAPGQTADLGAVLIGS